MLVGMLALKKIIGFMSQPQRFLYTVSKLRGGIAQIARIWKDMISKWKDNQFVKVFDYFLPNMSCPRSVEVDLTQKRSSKHLKIENG